MKKRLTVEIIYDASKVSPETLLTHLRAMVFRAEGLVDVNVVKKPKDEILAKMQKGVRDEMRRNRTKR